MNRRSNDLRWIDDFLGVLSELESKLLEEPRKSASGGSIVKEIESHDGFGSAQGRFNIIPGGRPDTCHKTLLVVIGHGVLKT